MTPEVAAVFKAVFYSIWLFAFVIICEAVKDSMKKCARAKLYRRLFTGDSPVSFGDFERGATCARDHDEADFSEAFDNGLLGRFHEDDIPRVIKFIDECEKDKTPDTRSFGNTKWESVGISMGDLANGTIRSWFRLSRPSRRILYKATKSFVDADKLFRVFREVEDKEFDYSAFSDVMELRQDILGHYE